MPKKAQSLLYVQDFPHFARLLAAFAGVAIPAAVVNSGLKYMQKRIQIAFQRRLTHHLHQQYCSNRAYYAASTLGGLTNADQRITEDVEKFAYNVSELYSYTFKVASHINASLNDRLNKHLKASLYGMCMWQKLAVCLSLCLEQPVMCIVLF